MANRFGEGPKRAGQLALVVVIISVAIQLFPMDRSNPKVRHDVDAPAAVDRILRNACYNCHSNETHWPWYSRVAPFSWLVTRHVHQGRGALNFSEWPALDFDAQDDLFEHIAKEVGQGHMPPLSYKLMHGEARLTQAQRTTLESWATGK